MLDACICAFKLGGYGKGLWQTAHYTELQGLREQFFYFFAQFSTKNNNNNDMMINKEINQAFPKLCNMSRIPIEKQSQ